MNGRCGVFGASPIFLCNLTLILASGTIRGLTSSPSLKARRRLRFHVSRAASQKIQCLTPLTRPAPSRLPRGDNNPSPSNRQPKRPNMAPTTVTLPVLAICIFLTALATTAVFTCIVCLHLRRSNRRLAYREEQLRAPPPPPAVDLPHVIDLPGSHAGGGAPAPPPAPPSFAPLQHGPSAELLLPPPPPGSPGAGGASGAGPGSRPGSGLGLFPPGRPGGGRRFRPEAARVDRAETAMTTAAAFPGSGNGWPLRARLDREAGACCLRRRVRGAKPWSGLDLG